MSEPLIFDSLTYIPIKDAAAGSHLSTEYLARLHACIGARTWFLEMHSLQHFLSTTGIVICV